MPASGGACVGAHLSSSHRSRQDPADLGQIGSRNAVVTIPLDDLRFLNSYTTPNSDLDKCATPKFRRCKHIAIAEALSCCCGWPNNCRTIALGAENRPRSGPNRPIWGESLPCWQNTSQISTRIGRCWPNSRRGRPNFRKHRPKLGQGWSKLPKLGQDGSTSANVTNRWPNFATCCPSLARIWPRFPILIDVFGRTRQTPPNRWPTSANLGRI